MKRREFLTGASALVLFQSPRPVSAQTTIPDLLAPGPLPEKSFGNLDAPVTIIEYASLTCPHCRAFHIDTWPAIKEKYVDTGKVRFIMREFPFDPRASAGFMLARCAGDDKWYATIDVLYRSQDRWARVSDPTTALKSVMGMTGMTGDAVETCLKDQSLLEKITAIAEAGKGFGVDSTPSFFINGKMQKGALTLEKFSEIIDPLVAAAKKP
ncbi:DSBA oxidoreductase [Mesorhizobium sp. STM 4661]|nr:DSBA oxidoreductase [Mesorhizobium sp. STM 4661]